MLLEAVLPDMSGFELLQSLRCQVAPIPIIVTAQAQHAIKAFEAGVLDYLLKPVRIERFQEAIRRAHGRCQEKGSVEPVLNRRHLLAGERERRLYLLTAQKIDYIESYGNYVKIWSGSAVYITRDRIKDLAARLADADFVRIERSILLNLRCVAYIERMGHGMFAFTLNSGTRLESTPTFRSEILRVVHAAAWPKRHGTDN
jgi:two-component system LytT family response regulator